MMQKLSRFVKKIGVFIRLPWSNRSLLVEALIYSAIARLVILVIPFKKYKKYMGKYNEETSFEGDSRSNEIINKVGWAVRVVCSRTPWQSKCLVQALIAQRMLRKRHICSTLYLGISKNEENDLSAHAWLRCGQVFITGGDNKDLFVQVARFSN